MGARRAWGVGLLLGVLLIGAATWTFGETRVVRIAVGTDPNGIDVNAATGRVYTANSGDDRLTVIDGATDTVVGTINLPDHATLVAVNPATNRLYANPAGHVRVIDAVTGDMIADLDLLTLFSMVADPVHNRIYAYAPAFEGPQRIAVIDGATDAIIGYVTLGISTYPESLDIDVNTSTNRLYVAYPSTSDLRVIDGETLQPVAAVPLGVTDRWMRVAVNPATNRVYVVAADRLVIVDGASNAILTTIEGLGGLDDVAVDPRRDHVYVDGIDSILVLDGRSGVLLAQVTDLPTIWALAVDPTLGKVYATHSFADAVSAIWDAVGALPSATPTSGATRAPTATTRPTDAVSPTASPGASPTDAVSPTASPGASPTDRPDATPTPPGGGTPGPGATAYLPIAFAWSEPQRVLAGERQVMLAAARRREAAVAPSAAAYLPRNWALWVPV